MFLSPSNRSQPGFERLDDSQHKETVSDASSDRRGRLASWPPMGFHGEDVVGKGRYSCDDVDEKKGMTLSIELDVKEIKRNLQRRGSTASDEMLDVVAQRLSSISVEDYFGETKKMTRKVTTSRSPLKEEDQLCRYCLEDYPPSKNFNMCACKGLICMECIQSEMQMTYGRSDGTIHCSVCMTEFDLYVVPDPDRNGCCRSYCVMGRDQSGRLPEPRGPLILALWNVFTCWFILCAPCQLFGLTIGCMDTISSLLMGRFARICQTNTRNILRLIQLLRFTFVIVAITLKQNDIGLVFLNIVLGSVLAVFSGGFLVSSFMMQFDEDSENQLPENLCLMSSDGLGPFRIKMTHDDWEREYMEFLQSGRESPGTTEMANENRTSTRNAGRVVDDIYLSESE
eukprot:140943_1